jgi:hypothetical protein
MARACLRPLEVPERAPDVCEGALVRVRCTIQEDRQRVLQLAACTGMQFTCSRMKNRLNYV